MIANINDSHVTIENTSITRNAIPQQTTIARPNDVSITKLSDNGKLFRNRNSICRIIVGAHYPLIDIYRSRNGVLMVEI